MLDEQPSVLVGHDSLGLQPDVAGVHKKDARPRDGRLEPLSDKTHRRKPACYAAGLTSFFFTLLLSPRLAARRFAVFLVVVLRSRRTATLGAFFVVRFLARLLRLVFFVVVSARFRRSNRLDVAFRPRVVSPESRVRT